VLPAGGLAGYKNASSDLSLTLVASQNIVNDGTITSASTLTALAGGTITNASAVGAAARLARVGAAGELDLLAGTVANQGVVSSTAGDVDIAAPSLYAATARAFANGAVPAALPTNININNTSGTVAALA
jgi:adhesin HecA-like repeat protein